MTKRVAINGYGRIGRAVLRALYESRQQFQELSVVAINEPADCHTIAYLTRYDSTHGRFPGQVQESTDNLLVNDDVIRVLHHVQLQDLPWQELDIDVVMECSGSFDNRIQAEQHLQCGAKKVIFSQPADSDVDATIVYGVNHQQLDGSERVISNASCTTNCVVPVIDALDRAFGIQAGVITTIHSAMNDQPVLDAYHHTDLRKTRAALQSIIPVDTGLARGIARLLPHLDGKFEAQAMRVPTLNVSAIDLSVYVNQQVDVSRVNAALFDASRQAYSGVLDYTDEPLASCDFNHDSHSGIVDASQTRVSGGQLVKVMVWFDNEWGYANRMLDVTSYWLQQPDTVN